MTKCSLKHNLVGHKGYINTVAVSPDDTLCASGGRDGNVTLWDLQEANMLYQLEAGDIIISLCFNPHKYWLCAATQSAIKIWDLETKNMMDSINLKDYAGRRKLTTVQHYCTSLHWSADGSNLFAGYTDGKIRVYSQ